MSRKTSDKNGVHFSSKRHDWETPQGFFEKLNAIHNFTLDVCATPGNAKCERFYTPETNALVQTWQYERCFMNPPYGRAIKHWVEKAATEWAKGRCLVVALLPARTDTRWFHEWVKGKAEIEFLKGRLVFEIDGKPVLDADGRPQSAPFPSMIATYGRRDVSEDE